MTLTTPLATEHEKLGARLATYFGCLLPERYTDLDTEYKLARERVALVDKSYRAFFEFTGPDRVRYLNAILSGTVRDLEVGHGAPSLLLNPQGHILAEIEIHALPDRLLGISYAMIRESLAATLEKYIIMDDVTLADLTERFTCLAVEGPAAPAVIRELTGADLNALPELGLREVQLGGVACRLVRRSPGGIPGAEFIFDRAAAASLWQVLLNAVRGQQGAPIGYATLNTLRLETGIPWFGYDFDETVIPHEAGLEQSHISYTKGCYIGQEIVERVRSRGHVNRRRVGLQFTGGMPSAGEALLAAGKEVGRVTRAGFSPALGRPIGMGYLPREHNAVGCLVEWSGGQAEVIELPLKSAVSSG